MTEELTRIQYPSNEDVVMLGKVTENSVYQSAIMMAKLTEANKQTIEATGYLVLRTKDKDFTIEENNIFLYGSISSKEDYDELVKANFKWCNEIHHGSFVPRNYDYQTHTGDAQVKGFGVNIPIMIETFDNVKMYQFGHARLGKPREVIIFRQYIKNRS